MANLADLFAEEEARRIAEANSPEALAREQAAWEARQAAPCPYGCGKAMRACECPPDVEPDVEECEECGAAKVPGSDCGQCDEEEGNDE